MDNLSLQGYSALLTSAEFWKSVQSERVLIFQTDAIPCRASTFNLDDFMSYDYVGAPVSKHVRALIRFLFFLKGRLVSHSNFYNGGLSYRTRSKMLEVIERYPWDELTSEDIWFCTFLPKVGGNLPPLEVARKFSYESEKLTTVPWGLHKPRKNYEKLCQVCPEVKEIPFVPSHTDYRNLYML